MNRIIYCECGSFIPIEVQDIQIANPRKCIYCCLKDAIKLMEGMKMEKCVDVVQFNASKLIRIKQPATTRHPHGQAIDFIEMTVKEAEELSRELRSVIGELIEEEQREHIEKVGL